LNPSPNTSTSSNSAISPNSSTSIEITPGDDTIIRPEDDTTDDIIAAFEGDDVISTGGGEDQVNGNRGKDKINLGKGNDIGIGGKDDDEINGEADDDSLFGNLGNDKLNGGDGQDLLFGGQGDDEITGGSGDDLISGDRGNDILTGSDGADIFQFRSGDGSDILTDFTPGTDKLRVFEIVSNASGNNLINGFSIGGNQLGSVRPLSFSDLTIGGNGTDSTLSFNGELLATLNGVASLSAADFV
jgi:Ca2+-binding RTX toxin-like protein